MPPDLNSLPPSISPSLQPRMSQSIHPQSPSPPIAHTPPTSLAAAAALNAGIQNEEQRRSPGGGSIRRDADRARRRSSIRMNLNLNDPSLPGPGELQMSPSARVRGPWSGSPHHERTPSLGELHQELEYEQEGQVNRLLNMIRQQQAQILTLQAAAAQTGNPSTSAIDDSTPTSERSLSFGGPPTGPTSHPPSVSASQQNLAQTRSRSPLPGPTSVSRHSSIADRSRGSSRINSPALRPMSGGGPGANEGEWSLGPRAESRDESAFYQAETQNLTRENQMLKHRIRELERQLSESQASPAHTPVQSSNLRDSPPISRSESLALGNEPITSM